MAKYKQSDYELLRRCCVELDLAGWKQGPIAQALGRFGGPIDTKLGESDPQEIPTARNNSLAMAKTHWSAGSINTWPTPSTRG